MQLRRGEHISEEALEQYAAHSLAEPASAEIEEHLLVCSQCQRQLAEIDAYVQAMRGAAEELQEEDEAQRRFWTRVSQTLTFRRLGWAMAVTAVALAGVALRLATRPGPSAAPYALVLTTSRGSEVQHAPAGRRLDLGLDAKGLPGLASYEMEIVDQSGRLVTRLQVSANTPVVRPPLADPLRPGTYFIRLYSSSKELLREYGLQVD